MRISSVIRRAAQVNGNALACEYLGRKLCWVEFVDKVARFACGLRRLGVANGDRVAMLSLNSDRYFEFFFAVPWAAAVAVPVNTRLAAPEVLYWLSDSGASVLLIDEQFLPLLEKLRDQIPNVRTIIFVGEGTVPTGMMSYADLLADADTISPMDTGGDELAALFYTGGTTGQSKGVMLSHRNLLLNAIQFAPHTGFNRDSVYLHAAPMFHVANGAMMFGIASVAGSSQIIPTFTPEAVLETIAAKKVSVGLFVPTMVNMIVNHPSAAAADLTSLKDVNYGASPMPEAVITRAIEIMPNTRFHQLYGQTEAAPVITILPSERHVWDGPLAGKVKSAGQATIGMEVKILDENDTEAPPGTVGQICARGDNVMKGYWNEPEMTAETLRGGWLHTGDGGYMDEDGFVFVVDRIKDMIISGGENVYSAEVEQAVYLHPAVLECAVIGIPSEKWGEQVHAIVRCKDGKNLDTDTLIAHCRERIASFKCPRSVDFPDAPLPISGAGKILKSELRKHYWDKKPV